MKKALDGIRVLDMTHVQSGPSCTQIMAWFGADVIKVELPGRGDITRQQLRDLPEVDSLYFTMLNCNKRSITVNIKTDKGKEIFSRLIAACDVLVENFAPGALDRQGFTWEAIQEINPRIVYASIKGFGAGPFVDCKAYETVAQAMGGAMSTTGWADGPPTTSGAQVGDTGTGMHLLAGILAALYHREKSGQGQRVEVAMQDAVLNLCRVKMRDQQRLANGPLDEYPNREVGDVVPRSGNSSGGGQPGTALRCKPGGPNDYIYTIIQPQGWAPLMKLIGRQELIEHPDYATPEARVNRLDEVFAIVEEWTQTHDKFEVTRLLNEINVPCGPILDMKDLIEDDSMAKRGAVVEVDHPERGTFKTVGCPIRLSDSPVEVTTSPLLGEHTEEILKQIVGFADSEIEEARETGAI
ncbi:MAG: formyl-CoA transferase [Proteobacteria bacterium]|nr:formyl-CoA transferase [Pseudomonadota bacterium]MCH8097521.1 formyl-CoA transferase [Pseudomonadota bacterium]